MEDVSPVECPVCQEKYDEGARCPRILACFHYLCNDCIHQLIQNKRNKCPFCRYEFQAKCAADVKINLGVLELVKYVSRLKLQGQLAESCESTVASPSVIGAFKQESIDSTSRLLTDCTEAHHQIEQMILETKDVRDNLQNESSNIQKNLLPKINEMISGNTKRIQELNRVLQKLERQLVEIKSKHTLLQTAKGKLDASGTLKDAAASVVGAEEASSTTDKWLETFEEQSIIDEETLFSARKELEVKDEKVSVVVDILNATESIRTRGKSIPTTGASAIINDRIWMINVADLQEMDVSVKNLVQKGKVFAVQVQSGKRRTARLTICGEKLLLHHLEDGKRLLNAVKLEHKEVLSLVSPQPRLAFLDLVANGLTLGRVFIRLESDKKRAKFFANLCTGELGYSYTNTKFLEVGFKNADWEYVRAGDYELNNGEGGKCLLNEPITELQEPRQWTAGTVEAMWGKGENLAAQFVIRTRSNPNHICPLAYGVVVEGLDVIRTAIRCYDDIGIVKIKDCGIVLFTSLGL